MAGFQVLEYNIDSLARSFAEYSLSTEGEIRQKFHLQYFKNYFGELNAKTIVVEPDYVDHDFIEDYAAYYVRCFESYERTTTRLHFFNIEFTKEQFQETLNYTSTELDEKKLADAYLGFIVVKKLPQKIIGRTCLKTYPDDNGRRTFPILRGYSANLFGIQLKIDSLAYQEQDTVVAACATSALWSCFQGTGKLFQHSIPSPVEITKAATAHVPENLPQNSARAFPNSGLTPSQMALAVKQVGLEPYVIGTPGPYLLNSTLYAYLRCRIPSILVFKLIDRVDGNDNELGRHAVAITGFSLGTDSPVPFHEYGFLLRASRIDKIYVHDDQVGPFARMKNILGDPPHLATSFQGTGEVKAIPQALLLPLYNKIRIPFEVIHDAIMDVDNLIEIIRKEFFPKLQRPEWDIYLTTINDLKKDVFNSMRAELGSKAEDHLVANLPRFLWRATARCGTDHHLDLLFDATGIAQQKLLVHVIALRQELPNCIAVLAPSVQDILGNNQAKAVFDYFSDK